LSLPSGTRALALYLLQFYASLAFAHHLAGSRDTRRRRRATTQGRGGNSKITNEKRSKKCGKMQTPVRPSLAVVTPMRPSPASVSAPLIRLFPVRFPPAEARLDTPFFAWCKPRASTRCHAHVPVHTPRQIREPVHVSITSKTSRFDFFSFPLRLFFFRTPCFRVCSSSARGHHEQLELELTCLRVSVHVCGGCCRERWWRCERQHTATQAGAPCQAGQGRLGDCVPTSRGGGHWTARSGARRVRCTCASRRVRHEAPTEAAQRCADR
jgi:hypothetical protein